jgi:membrane protease YdiL (CAAX protease family)
VTVGTPDTHHPAISATPSAAARHRRQALNATLAVVAALAAVNVARFLMPAWSIWLSVAAAGALLLFARRTGLTWAQLGLCPKRFRAGRRWGIAAVTAVGVVYLVGVLSQALTTAFVVIPLGTVLLEEVAFRGVLWGMLSRHMTTWRVVMVSSSLFGLWHILPSLNFAAAHEGLSSAAPHAGLSATLLVVLGTVAFTAVGGVVAAELRRRSGSVLASAGMHWATNALGVLFGVVAWRLAG